MTGLTERARVPVFSSSGDSLSARNWLTLLSIVGYPVVAGISAEVGLTESPVLSILVRLITAGLGIFCFARALRDRAFSQAERIVFCAYLLFWTLYILRVIDAAYFKNSILPWSGAEYIGYALIFSILPSLGAIDSDATPADSSKMLWLMTSGFCIALLTNLHQFLKEATDLSFLTGGRAQSEKLNPISLGVMAANALLVLYILWQDGRLNTLAKRSVAAMVCALAVAGLVLSGSKGPALALLVSILGFHLFPLTVTRSVRVLGGTIILLLILGLSAYQLNKFVEINLINRFIDLASGQNTDQSSQERLLAYRSAWEQILDAPILGSSLVEKALHYYPHNLVLEIFLSTGVIGMMLITTPIAFSIYRGCQHLESMTSQRWIVLMLLQALVSSMVSGGIHMASQLWFLIIACAFSSADSAIRARHTIERI